MTFSKILQSLILLALGLGAPLLMGREGVLAEEKGAKKIEKASQSDKKKTVKETNISELNLTVGKKEPIEAQIQEQLKHLNDLPALKTSSKTTKPILSQTATAHLSKQDEHLFIKLTSDKPIKSLASFAQGANWYVVLAGVSEIIIKQDEQLPNLKAIHTLKADSGEAILKISLNVRQTPTTLQTPQGLELSFQAKYNFKNCNDLIQLPSDPEKPYRLRTRFGDQEIEFEDPQTYHHFWVLTGEKPYREIDEHSYPEFRLLPSLIGVAIDKISEDLNIKYHHRKVFVALNSGLSVSPSFAVEDGLKPQSIFTKFNPETAPERIIALTQLTSQASQQIVQKNMELVWQYLGVGKIPEALSVLHLLQENYPDIVLMPAFRALKGLAQLLLNRSHKANELLKVLSYDPEPDFWCRIAEAISNAFIDTDSLHDLVQYKNYFELLPDPLRVRLQGLVLQTAILHKDSLVLKVFADKRFYPDDLFVASLFKLANVFITLDVGGNNQAIDQLKALSQNLISKRVATLASFELIKIDEKNKSIPLTQILSRLNQLRFQWRGDLLEYKITLHYIHLLGENKFYAKTLPILRSLIKYFPEQAQKDKLPQIMQENLMAFFNQVPAPSLMESLSIFQEFGDLAPNNKEGDQIILKATSELIHLNLYQDALDILKKYTHKKLQESDTSLDRKNMFAYKVAVIHLLAKDSKTCLQALDKVVNPSSALADDVALLKAEAYMQRNEIQAALDSLGETPLQIEKKGEIYFTQEKWGEAAKYYEKSLELLPGENKQARAKCIYNLALCYALRKDKDKLSSLKEAYSPLMEESIYKDKFLFLTTDTAFDSALTSTEFGKIDSFANNLKQVFKNIDKAM